MTNINLNIKLTSIQHAISRFRNLYSNTSTFKKQSNAANIRNITSDNIDYRKRIVSSDTRNFVSVNADLINFIGNDRQLTSILQQRKSVKDRNDLEEVIIAGAMKKLDSNSPVSQSFLKEHLEFAKFIAADIGGIADILNDDRALAKRIVNDGDVVGNSILSSIANKVSSLLGESSIVTEEFLNDHPEAAIHLLMHPSTLSRIRTDTAAARTFVTELSRNAPSYNSEIASKAKELLNMPHIFTTELLENEKKFSQVVVASTLNEDTLKLPDYIHNNPDLTLDDFTTSGLIKSYQVALAMSEFSGDFPLDKEFFSKNKSITSAVILSDKFVSNLKKETSQLEKFFGSGKFNIDFSNNANSTISGLYSSPFKPNELKAFSVSLFA